MGGTEHSWFSSQNPRAANLVLSVFSTSSSNRLYMKTPFFYTKGSCPSWRENVCKNSRGHLTESSLHLIRDCLQECLGLSKRFQWPGSLNGEHYKGVSWGIISTALLTRIMLVHTVPLRVTSTGMSLKEKPEEVRAGAPAQLRRLPQTFIAL